MISDAGRNLNALSTNGNHAVTIANASPFLSRSIYPIAVVCRKQVVQT